MKHKLKAIIIGAGKIGALFDQPNSKNILTHAHAYKEHGGFELVGFVDCNFSRAKKASKIWGGIPAKKLSELLKKTKIDVASVCVPDENHYEILKEIETAKIGGGIIEKPLTNNLSDSKKIIESIFFKNHPFIINYMRRFMPEFKTLREKCLKGNYGKFLTGNCIYGKGLLHNGSHLIDLLRYLLGEIKNKKILSLLYDFGPQDPTATLMLELQNGGTVLLNAMDSRYYTVCELDLYFEKGRLKIIDSGSQIQIYTLRKNPVFKGYRKIGLANTINASLPKAMYYTVDELYQTIRYGKQPVCTIEDGYKAQRICTVFQ